MLIRITLHCLPLHSRALNFFIVAMSLAFKNMTSLQFCESSDYYLLWGTAKRTIAFPLPVVRVRMGRISKQQNFTGRPSSTADFLRIFRKDRFSYPHQGGWGAWGRRRWPWLGAVNIGGCEYITGRCTTFTIRHNITGRPRENSDYTALHSRCARKVCSGGRHIHKMCPIHPASPLALHTWSINAHSLFRSHSR